MHFPFIAKLTTLALLSISSGLYGQSKNATDLFPSYQQIKPAISETVDYVSPQGKPGTIVQQAIGNLFNYPENTATYILNGKPTTDAIYAKKLVTQKDTHIEQLFIERPAADGKQTIRIDYSIIK